MAGGVGMAGVIAHLLRVFFAGSTGMLFEAELARRLAMGGVSFYLQNSMG